MFEKLNKTTFRQVAKDNPKDRLEVIIGDDKQPDFKPLKVGFGYRLYFPSIKKTVINTVLPAFCEKIKVFNSIVGLYFVDMMDNFIFCKIAAKMFFNRKTVFRDISLFVVKRMIRTFNKAITFATKFNSTFPIIVVFPSIISSFPFIPRDISFGEFSHAISIATDSLIVKPIQQ